MSIPDRTEILSRIDPRENFQDPDGLSVEPLLRQGRELAYGPRKCAAPARSADNPAPDSDSSPASTSQLAARRPAGQDGSGNDPPLNPAEQYDREHLINWYRDNMKRFIQMEYNNSTPHVSDLAQVNNALAIAHQYNSPLEGALQRLQARLTAQLAGQPGDQPNT
jgi:hypothetical protein